MVYRTKLKEKWGSRKASRALVLKLPLPQGYFCILSKQSHILADTWRVSKEGSIRGHLWSWGPKSPQSQKTREPAVTIPLPFHSLLLGDHNEG